MLKGPVMRDGIEQRVCYRMITKDRERARRIAGEIGDPSARAYTLGMMALALIVEDKDTAGQLLDEALVFLAALAGPGNDKITNIQAATTAAVLLPVVEQLDPGRVSEVLWRAIALRRPRRDDDHEEIRRLGSEAVTSLMVARYDRAIAQTLLGPILDRIPGLIAGGVSYLPETLFTAAAIVDPHRAVALIEGLPADSDSSRGRWDEMRRNVAEMLSLPGAERRRRAVQEAGFWDVDGYDLGDDD
jgi:hypothetical protein